MFTVLVPSSGRVAADAVLLIGVGDPSAVTLDGLRRAAASLSRASSKVATVATTLLDAAPSGDGAAAAAEALAEGVLLGAYQFLEYKSKATATSLRRVMVLDGRADVKRGLERGDVIAHATIWARDVVNQPSGFQSPSDFVSEARRVLSRSGVTVQALGGAQLRTQRLGGVLGVGQGSARPPRFLKISYEPRGRASNGACRSSPRASGAGSNRPQPGAQVARHGSVETHAPGSRPSGAAVRCAGLCAGLALAALARLALAGLPPDERATLWVLDRGADRALALDRDLEVKTSVSIDAPRRVVACADGGAWIAGASDGRDSLVRIGTDGSRIRSFEFARMLDLEPAGAEVVVLEQGQACTVWLLDESGRARSLRAMPGASCVAARGELILTGHRGGEAVLQEHGDPGAVRAWARIGTRLADVQPGPRRGSWWILDAGGGGRILLVDDLLATLWSVNLEREPGSTDPALEPVRGEERVWIAEPGSSRVRRFERHRDLSGDRQRFVEGHRTVRDPVRERRSLDQLQHQGADAVDLLETVDGRDLRVVQ